MPSPETAGGGVPKIDEIPRRLVHSPREAQILLGVSRAHVYRLVHVGRLTAVKLGGARTGITRDSIEALAAGREQ